MRVMIATCRNSDLRIISGRIPIHQSTQRTCTIRKIGCFGVAIVAVDGAALESNQPIEVSLLTCTIEFCNAKPTSVLTRTKLLEVANARGIEPLLMPTVNFEIEEPDEPHASAKVSRKKSGIDPLVMPTMNFDIPTSEDE